MPAALADYDGLIRISSRAGEMTVLQYPTAYPLFSRLHVWAARIIEGKLHHKKIASRTCSHFSRS
jgi:hypothetical protein